MNNVIWKYVINGESITLDIPEGGEILTAQMQGETLCIWVRVDPRSPMVSRTIRVFGTGHTMKPDGEYKYINTFQVQEGAFLFHVFEDLTYSPPSP